MWLGYVNRRTTKKRSRSLVAELQSEKIDDATTEYLSSKNRGKSLVSSENSLSAVSGLTSTPGSKKTRVQSTLTPMGVNTAYEPGAGAKLDMALADLSHSLGVPFSLPSSQQMIKVLDLARKDNITVHYCSNY